MSDSQNPLDSATFHDPRLEYQEQQEQKRITFEADQERKRQEFELRLEKQKAKRDWMMVIITFVAVAAAYLTVWEAHRTRLDAHDALLLDERPFVYPKLNNVTLERSFRTDTSGPIPKPISILNGEAHFEIVAVGKTPAFYVQSDLAPKTDIFADRANAIAPLIFNSSTQWIVHFELPQSGGRQEIRHTIIYQDYFKQWHHYSFCYQTGGYGPTNKAGFAECAEFKDSYD